MELRNPFFVTIFREEVRSLLIIDLLSNSPIDKEYALFTVTIFDLHFGCVFYYGEN